MSFEWYLLPKARPALTLGDAQTGDLMTIHRGNRAFRLLKGRYRIFLMIQLGIWRTVPLPPSLVERLSADPVEVTGNVLLTGY